MTKERHHPFDPSPGLTVGMTYQFHPPVIVLLLPFSIWEKQEPKDLCIFGQLSILTLSLDRVIPRRDSTIPTIQETQS